MTYKVPADAHPADFVDPSDADLRGRGYYIKQAGRFIGFGRLAPQLDLFKTEYRLGWWTLGVCRACMIEEIRNLREELARHKAAIARAKTDVASAIGVVDKRTRGD